jgi:hypothetical protein
VRVEGSVWVPSETYAVKLEGAGIAGYQTILVATLRDPRCVANVRTWTADILVKHAAKVAKRLGLDDSEYSVQLRVVGDNATLGDLEQVTSNAAEVGVICIVTAADQETANEIGKVMNPYLLHHPLTREEEQPTFSFPFSPAEIDRGPTYEFRLNHVLTLDDPMAAFKLEVIDAAG